MKREDLLKLVSTGEGSGNNPIEGIIKDDTKFLKRSLEDLKRKLEDLEDSFQKRLSSFEPIDASTIENSFNEISEVKSSIKLYETFKKEFYD